MRPSTARFTDFPSEDRFGWSQPHSLSCLSPHPTPLIEPLPTPRDGGTSVKQLAGMRWQSLAMRQSGIHWRVEGWVEKQPDVTKITLGLKAGNEDLRSAFLCMQYAVRSGERLFCSLSQFSYVKTMVVGSGDGLRPLPLS